jgi:hypothetical protein
MMKPISVLYKYKRVGLGAQLTRVYTPPRETLAVASSRLNFEALATHVVLARPHTVFHPCTCGFR